MVGPQTQMAVSNQRRLYYLAVSIIYTESIFPWYPYPRKPHLVNIKIQLGEQRLQTMLSKRGGEQRWSRAWAELWPSLRSGVACLWQRKPISKQILLAFFALKEYFLTLDRAVNNRSGFETWKQSCFLFLSSEILKGQLLWCGLCCQQLKPWLSSAVIQRSCMVNLGN